MITTTGEEDIATKAVAQVQQIQNETAGITTREIKIPADTQIDTKGDDLKTEFSLDASISTANDSKERTLLEKEATVTVCG